jgi:hypothetical protein|eukprot:COSAG01_NODE_281_length_19504_cov_129.173124_28_plen_30_part_00
MPTAVLEIAVSGWDSDGLMLLLDPLMAPH